MPTALGPLLIQRTRSTVASMLVSKAARQRLTVLSAEGRRIRIRVATSTRTSLATTYSTAVATAAWGITRHNQRARRYASRPTAMGWDALTVTRFAILHPP